MYQDSNMLASIRKVEAAREENAKLDPRRMTAEEKDTLLKKFHPDYRAEQFTDCLLYTSPSPRAGLLSRMPSSA